MSTKIKAGKLPVTSRPQAARITADEAFGGGGMVLPEDIAEHGRKEGLSFRWLNASEVYKNQGYHTRGWQVYKRPNPGPINFQFGQDPEGVVRRGDCILGYKTKEAVTRHKEYLRQKAEDYSAGQKKQSIEDMRATARQAGSQFIDEDEQE